MKLEARSQKSAADCAATFSCDGFEIFDEVISCWRCDELAAELSSLFQTQQGNSKSKIGGIRNLLQTSQQVAELANGAALAGLCRTVLGQIAFPVRALFFDKTSDSNWRVPWHQDLSIAVAERVETAGFDGWSVKEGVVHVQPPCEILEGMVTIRLHLDDCDAANGALRVLPGSHAQGRLNAAQITKWADKTPVMMCEVRKGGALLMRPLLLHSSSPSVNPTHRRVLHIEYATNELPDGLRWFARK